MKKNIILIGSVMISSFSYSQSGNVGINTSSPLVTLDVVGKPTDSSYLDGIICPRLTGAQLKLKNYTSAQTGALIYVTAADPSPAGQTINVSSAGYYYFDGTKWIANDKTDDAFVNNSAAGRVELGTNSNGTTGRTSGTEFVVQDNGNVGIGSSTPTTKLEINNGSTAGAIKIVDGNQKNGYVLTSDTNGLATWKQSGGTIAANEGTLESNSNSAWSFTVNNNSSYTALPSFTSVNLTTGVYFVTIYQCPGQLTISPTGQGVYWSLLSSNGGIGSGEVFFEPLTTGACSGYVNFIFKVTTAGNFTLAVRKYATNVSLSAPAGFNASILGKIDALSH